MLRNMEVRILLISFAVLSMTASISGFYISVTTGWFTVLLCMLFMICAYMFSLWRYTEIKKLSNYLRRISNGDFRLDVRNNHEGELSILRNELFKVTNKLSEQSAQLNLDKRHLTEAISDISHQLKTPLTSMNMMADLLNKEHVDDDKRQEFTTTLKKQISRMEWLVAALLKLSKIDAGTAIFKQERVHVAELVTAVTETMAIPLDIKAQTLTVDGAHNVRFTGDFEWTSEALVNLLKNSIEHTPDGGWIAIRYVENTLYTEIVISDNGGGIPKKDLPYIFQRFYKGEKSSENSVGIGLAMAYSIVKEQSGDIKVESNEEIGTTFTIKLYK